MLIWQYALFSVPVLGTDAWIDASGYLRQKDYIADDKGYRILKSKTVYVGTDLPIQVYAYTNETVDSMQIKSFPSFPGRHQVSQESAGRFRGSCAP